MEQINKSLMNWASIIEPKTLEQAKMTAAMPFVKPHLALMPDAHLGKGATVGSVIPTYGAIMPAAVGVDIGCGMDAWRLELTARDIEGLDRAALRLAIEKAIPLSPGNYNTGWDEYALEAIDQLEALAEDKDFDPADYAGNWKFQLGSLGGGNHFIELCLDQDDRVWLFLHSGSRGVGNKIAQAHIKTAQWQCARRYIDLPDPDLAYLVEGEYEFDRYIDELRWAQEFARLNRSVMMSRFADCLDEWVGGPSVVSQAVSCHHNYTERERHGDLPVWLSRKGAISAKAGEWGLIPGSMGDLSYVVQGKGNRLALESAPHGAGRVHSRSSAKRTFTLADLEARMGDIEFRRDEAFVDEHPAAYKPIDQVMQDAADLVDVRFTLRQIVNVKGQ